MGAWTMGLLDDADWHADWIGYDAPYAELIRHGVSPVLNTSDGMQKSALIRTLRRFARFLLHDGHGLRWLKFLQDSFKSFLQASIRRLLGRFWLRRMRAEQPELVPCPHLRREFSLNVPAAGILHVSALGVCDLYVNGRCVSEQDYFVPGWTDYKKRVYYQTYDVGPFLREGGNAIGVVLADGWYCGYVGPGRRRQQYGLAPRVALQLHVSYADGTSEVIVSDGDWRATTGPYIEADLQMGETYDARLELPGWDAHSFDDSAWSRVDVGVESDAPPPPCAMPHQPVRRSRELRPVSVREPGRGLHIFDMGENFAGWVRLRLRAPSGTRITLRFGERLESDGNIYVANLRGARAMDCYITKGKGEEVWEPRFTYHGFQYVEVTGLPGDDVSTDTIVGVAISSIDMTAGEFACSHPLLNKLAANIVRTQEANFVEVPTDCPQRDERLGWLGDAQIFLATSTYNADVAGFIKKWLVDVTDAQSLDGAFTDFAPQGCLRREGSPAWADAGVIIPWEHYRAYEDNHLVEFMYASMRRFVELIHEENPNHLWTKRVGENNGEWVEIGASTPKDLVATGYFARSTQLLSRMAALLGYNEDTERYESLLRSIRDAFVSQFVLSDGRIRGGTQTAYVLALRFGLIPDQLRSAAAGWLVEDIQERGDRLTTGFFGTGHIADVLTENNHIETAYQLVTSEKFPSWGYSIRQGATSIWEHWDGWTEHGGFQDPLMNSFSHYGFGAVGGWLFSTVAGIAPAAPGYREILIHPRPGGGLSWARARYKSIRGLIATSWKCNDQGFHLELEIPANTTATVVLPCENGGEILEGGRPFESVSEVTRIEINSKTATLRIGSGHYCFDVIAAGAGGCRVNPLC
jgi:alpha-L-rhamnosidase